MWLRSLHIHRLSVTYVMSKYLESFGSTEQSARRSNFVLTCHTVQGIAQVASHSLAIFIVLNLCSVKQLWVGNEYYYEPISAHLPLPKQAHDSHVVCSCQSCDQPFTSNPPHLYMETYHTMATVHFHFMASHYTLCLAVQQSTVYPLQHPSHTPS